MLLGIKAMNVTYFVYILKYVNNFLSPHRDSICEKNVTPRQACSKEEGVVGRGGGVPSPHNYVKINNLKKKLHNNSSIQKITRFYNLTMVLGQGK